jgi:DUF2891 family protein
VVTGPEDLCTPKATHPAFYGCFDWHSAVHSHWALARILRCVPDVAVAHEIREVFDEHLTAKNLEAERALFTRPINAHYERPYGWAWLLTLASELAALDDPRAGDWARAMAPLAVHFADRLRAHLEHLAIPERAGTHRNTAYSLGLALDYARAAGETDLEELIVIRSRDFYGSDRDWPFVYEPSGTDFLSPGLAEADLMRRILAGGEIERWLLGFLPGGTLPRLAPVIVGDRKDPLESHLIGMAFHRAIALNGIAGALDPDHPLTPGLLAMAAEHEAIGLSQTDGTGWGGEHWLGSFAVYSLTGP